MYVKWSEADRGESLLYYCPLSVELTPKTVSVSVPTSQHYLLYKVVCFVIVFYSEFSLLYCTIFEV